MDKMDSLKELISEVWQAQLIKSIIVVIVSLILYNSVTIIFKDKDSSRLFGSKKGKTYLKMVKSIIRYIFIIVTALIILQINGINVGSMLAGVGLLGVIIGFAVQDALKDIIKGFDIISDSYYQVGDTIKYGDVEGKVLVIGLKTTKIEDIYTKNIISIANRNIDQVEIVSTMLNIIVPMPYEVKLKDAEKAIEDILKLINEIKDIEKSEYRGVDKLADSSINYHIKVYCNPALKPQIRRDVLRCVLLGLDKENISVPYNQIDVHNK